MENFGYLEMAIAQENNAQERPSSTKKPKTNRPAFRQACLSKALPQEKPDDFQFLGCWGMF